MILETWPSSIWKKMSTLCTCRSHAQLDVPISCCRGLWAAQWGRDIPASCWGETTGTEFYCIFFPIILYKLIQKIWFIYDGLYCLLNLQWTKKKKKLKTKLSLLSWYIVMSHCQWKMSEFIISYLFHKSSHLSFWHKHEVMMWQSG